MFLCLFLGAACRAENPAPASWSGDVPVGLYFMSRYISGGGLEKMAWYFAPDGTVYENLSTGLTDADLAAHRGRKGKATGKDNGLTVTWTDGTQTKAPMEKDKTGFGWDMGIFTPVEPIKDAASIAGSYEGGETLSRNGSLASSARTLDLKADGTYSSGSAASVSASGNGSKIEGGASSSSGGKWTCTAWTITLTDAGGKSAQHLAFPYDDADAKVHPAHLYIGGTLFKHR